MTGTRFLTSCFRWNSGLLILPGSEIVIKDFSAAILNILERSCFSISQMLLLFSWRNYSNQWQVVTLLICHCYFKSRADLSLLLLYLNSLSKNNRYFWKCMLQHTKGQVRLLKMHCFTLFFTIDYWGKFLVAVTCTPTEWTTRANNTS